MPFSQKLQILWKPNCTWMFIGWSSTNFTFFVLIWNSKWRLRQDLAAPKMNLEWRETKFIYHQNLQEIIDRTFSPYINPWWLLEFTKQNITCIKTYGNDQYYLYEKCCVSNILDPQSMVNDKWLFVSLKLTCSGELIRNKCHRQSLWPHTFKESTKSSIRNKRLSSLIVQFICWQIFFSACCALSSGRSMFKSSNALYI
jgi:hypothetical protein